MSVHIRYKKWVIDFYKDGRKGKRIKLTLPEGIKTREEALEYEKQYKKFQREEPLRPPVNASIETMSTMFFEYCAMHLAATTTRDIKSCFKNHVIPALGKVRAESITLTHFHNYKKKELSLEDPTEVSRKR